MDSLAIMVFIELSPGYRRICSANAVLVFKKLDVALRRLMLEILLIDAEFSF